MEKKWYAEIDPNQIKRYRLDEIIVGYDRLSDEYITLDQISVVASIRNLRAITNK